MHNKNDVKYYEVYHKTIGECLICELVKFNNTYVFKSLAFYGCNKKEECTVIKCDRVSFIPFESVTYFSEIDINLDEAEPLKNWIHYEDVNEKQKGRPTLLA